MQWLRRVEVQFRMKGIKVQREISETSRENLSDGGLQTPPFHPQSKLLFHTFKHSIFFFLSEAWDSELQQTMNRNPEISVFLKDYIAADSTQTIYLLWET